MAMWNSEISEPVFVFTEVIFSPLAQMLVVQQCTGQVVSNLIGKILTGMTPGQPGTISSGDSILEAAGFSFIFCFASSHCPSTMSCTWGYINSEVV